MDEYYTIGKINGAKSDNGIYIKMSAVSNYSIQGNDQEKELPLNVWVPNDKEDLNKQTKVLTMKPVEWIKIEEKLLNFIKCTFTLTTTFKVIIYRENSTSQTNDYIVKSVELDDKF